MPFARQGISVRSLVSFLVCLAITAATSTHAAALSEADTEPEYTHKLVIVSSFPKAIGAIYKQAFEARNPGIEVEVIKKKTAAGIKYLDEIKDNNHVDLYWVSAPDAFEVLKKKKLLQQYEPLAQGIPRRLSGYPVNDLDGYYSGFASSGYGIMWNTDYLKEYNLPEPKEWIDLTRPEYRGHIGLSSPSRSGTTHLTIEAMLQLKGWIAGWSLIKGIAANAKIITAKSSHVPKGVIDGEFGLGIVIDLYGLSSIANEHPIKFVYPSASVFVPANIGIVKNAPEAKIAKQFIEFLLSVEGQRLLLEPDISRLPIRPEIYESGLPDYYPRPYSSEQKGSHIPFNVHKSTRRYNVVNSLFDVMVTYQLDDLQFAMGAIQNAESGLISVSLPQPQLAAAINQSRDLINNVPIDEFTSLNPDYAAKFTKRRKKETDPVDGEQAEIEQQWRETIQDNYADAYDTAEYALSDAMQRLVTLPGSN